MSQAAAVFEGIHHRFGQQIALQKIDLTIERGAFVVLLGPSGSGKTTLLNILGGFLEPTAGRVLINGADVTNVPPAKRPTTTVFQDYALFPHMSVARNVGFGLDMRRIARQAQGERIEQALEMVGLEGMGRRRIHELSGGQRQRIALARSLVVEPEVLLLDEPLGALDLHLRRQMQHELKQIQRRVGTTFVHVTHDQDEAMSIADVIVVMDQGQIEDVGPPERVYRRPSSRFAARFMGESNLIPVSVIERREHDLLLETPFGGIRLDGRHDTSAARPLEVALRPEQLRLRPLGAALTKGELDLGEAVLRSKDFLGAHHVVGLEHDAGFLLKAHLPQESALQVGERVALSTRDIDLVLLTR